MHVIGTAGHVDHGKSTLIQALTGIDPDRLQEEKNRGMTIDLGFAWLKLPSLTEVSIVDVPGHERFIKNMLAGVGGIDLAILVVAADEGVMPQTREHIAILDLLKVERAITVITKSDLVDSDFLPLVEEQIIEELSETSLAGSQVISVSAFKGTNLDKLILAIDSQLESIPERIDLGRPRLPIDRSFSISGFGTVVTGTLIDGSLKIGQELEVIPSGKKVRIRGLESHKKKLSEIGPGVRTAVNLSGITASELNRGQILTNRGWLHTTRSADIRIRMIQDAPGTLKHNLEVDFHWMSAETKAKVRLLDSYELDSGEDGWCQVLLDNALPLVKGDFCIIRTSLGTLCGGQIVEIDVKRHKRNDSALIARLESLAAEDSDQVVIQTIENSDGLDIEQISKITSLAEDTVSSIVVNLIESGKAIGFSSGSSQIILTESNWANFKSRCENYLTSHHSQYPLRKGLPREELRSKLKINNELFQETIARLESEGLLIQDGTDIKMNSYSPTLSIEDRRFSENYLIRLNETPHTPPTDLTIDPELLTYLSDTDQVVVVGGNIVYSRIAYDHQVSEVLKHIEKNGTISVGETRDLLSASRKYVLPLLESMDEQRLTRRSGDNRILN
tara:strand:- start:1221 stop:3074 length:1854 start_codon:yes stop_codon:yes gene_type:complete